MITLNRLLFLIMGEHKTFSLRHRIVNMIVFSSILGFILCFFVNILYDKDYANSLICLLGLIINIISFYISRIRERFELAFSLFFFLIIYILLPLFWFKNQGTYSGLPFYYLVIAGFIITILKGRKIILYLSFNIISYFTLIYLEYRFPFLLTVYEKTTYRYMDMVLDSLIAMGILAVLYFSLVKSYDIEHKKVMDLLKVDYLSECYNRRYFIQVLNDSISLYEKNKIPFSIIIVDIDNFKQVNDREGHIEGDNLIKEMGSFLKEYTQEYNSITARYGGDEFIILLDRTSLNKAVNLAKKICLKTSQRRWNNYRNITISIGVAEYEGGDIEDIIRKADKQLYIAKEQGKNQISYG